MRGRVIHKQCQRKGIGQQTSPTTMEATMHIAPPSPMADPSSGTVVHLTSHGRKTQLPMPGRTIAQMPMPNEIVAKLLDLNKYLWKPNADCPDSGTAGYTLAEGECLSASRWRVTATPYPGIRGKEHALGRQLVANAFGM